MTLAPQQIARYARHVLLDGVGREGQEQLLASAVHVRGDGPSADEAATYLVAAGVGRIVLDPALAERSGARYRAMNGDVDVCLEGPVDLVLDPCRPDTRLVGATAALTLLCGLTGAADYPRLALEDQEIPWQRA